VRACCVRRSCCRTVYDSTSANAPLGVLNEPVCAWTYGTVRPLYL
jgi:hypothetical protein